jgi:hypothetical protein
LQTKGKFQFDLAANGLTGDFDREIEFDLSGVFEQPVAADMNGDGIDDVGLFVTRREGVPPAEAAEWFFLVSTDPTPTPGEVTALNHAFSPVPFGTDLFAQFGDEMAAPVVGNFDPPTSPPDNPAPPADPVLDVNRDGYVTPLDSMIVINGMNLAAAEGESPPTLSGSAAGDVWHLDVNGDSFVTALDVLLIVNRLNDLASGGGEGEAVSQAAPLPVLTSDGGGHTLVRAAVEEMWSLPDFGLGESSVVGRINLETSPADSLTSPTADVEPAIPQRRKTAVRSNLLTEKPDDGQATSFLQTVLDDELLDLLAVALGKAQE